MIKPILYHNIEDKNKLEQELLSKVPMSERIQRSRALMDIFFHLNPKQTKKKKNNVSKPRRSQKMIRDEVSKLILIS